MTGAFEPVDADDDALRRVEDLLDERVEVAALADLEEEGQLRVVGAAGHGGLDGVDLVAPRRDEIADEGDGVAVDPDLRGVSELVGRATRVRNERGKAQHQYPENPHALPALQ